MMKTNFYYPIILALLFTFLYSCKDDEIELGASGDMLFSVRTNDIIIEVKDVANKKEITQAIEKRLREKIHFVEGNVYEMKQNLAKDIDLYENRNAYDNKKIKASGKYSFEPNTMSVTFDFGDSMVSYSINGYFGNGFYTHFLYKEGGSCHTVEAAKIFCLHNDYTEELQQEYPDLVHADIKTDMITIRSLETFK